MKKKKLISWLLGVALAIPMNFFGGGYFPSQVVYAADNQEVVTAGQRIDIGLSEDRTQKTLSIRDSDKKTEIGSLTWTDENTTYRLSGASGTLTLSGSDGSKDDVSIGYDPDAINKRISAIDTTITGVENNLKSILSAVNGTAETKDVREGQTFSSAKGIGISGTMTKVRQEDISVIAAGGTNIKITVKSGAPGSYKYVDDSGDSITVVDLIDVKDENGDPIAMGDATESQVLSGRTFSNNAGFNKVGTMPDNGAWTSESSGNGKLTIPEGYHNGQGYVDLSGSYNDGYDAGKKTVIDSPGDYGFIDASNIKISSPVGVGSWGSYTATQACIIIFAGRANPGSCGYYSIHDCNKQQNACYGTSTNISTDGTVLSANNWNRYCRMGATDFSGNVRLEAGQTVRISGSTWGNQSKNNGSCSWSYTLLYL